MMGWLSFIPNLLKGTKDVAEVFTENKEKKGERQHDEQMADMHLDMAVLNQFAAEFHQRQNRTWWDSLIDGLNRLPRPLITIAVLSFFVIAPLNPVEFMEIAKAYSVVPNGYWALLSIILGFYFGGRMQVTQHSMELKGNALQAAKELVALRRQYSQDAEPEQSVQEKQYKVSLIQGESRPPNQVVEKWKAQQAISQ